MSRIPCGIGGAWIFWAGVIHTDSGLGVFCHPRRESTGRPSNNTSGERHFSLMGGVGLGKNHIATALGYEACQRGHSVLFTTTVDALNNLVAAQAAHRLKAELKRYLAPAVLLLDELG